MPNLWLPERFVEVIGRLLLGMQPMDALRVQRLAHRIIVAIEPIKPWVDPLTGDQQRWLQWRIDNELPLSDSWPQLIRHASNRYVFAYAPGYGDHVDLRFLDPTQRTVPRRLRVPLVSLGHPEKLTVLDALPVGKRSRRPAFFPGAAYDAPERLTGLRGRVVISDPVTPATKIPVRWPRIEARLKRDGQVIAWAHGDQFGEFFLILPPEAIPAPAVALASPLTLSITARGRQGPAVTVPPTPTLVQRADPFWDVPREEIGAPGIDPDLDLVALGRVIPADYTGTATQNVTFSYSEIISSGIPPFDIT